MKQLKVRCFKEFGELLFGTCKVISAFIRFYTRALFQSIHIFERD